MKNLRLFSLLLDYPTAELVAAREPLAGLVSEMPIGPDGQRGLDNFIRRRCDGDLLDWQAEYDALFERGRALSLLLFEHVHGESRDRGQAMVDLMEQYRRAGFTVSARELPDYLPLYLEFLSTREADEARRGLQEVAHILGLLTGRLRERDSDYAAVTAALLEWSGAPIDLDDVQRQLAGEQRDDTPRALDKVWEEEAVTFGAQNSSDGCAVQYRPAPGQQRDQEQMLELVQPLRKTNF